MKDGIRTRDRQGHNLELYRLSYLHRRDHTPPRPGVVTPAAVPLAARQDTTSSGERHTCAEPLASGSRPASSPLPGCGSAGAAPTSSPPPDGGSAGAA